MNNKPELIIVFVILSFFNCADNKSINQSVIELESKVRLELDIQVLEDDTFQVFYTESGTGSCTEQNSVKAIVKGSNFAQKIIFDLPEEKRINYIRIDIGTNPNQRTIKVNNFRYKYFDEILEVEGRNFFKYYGSNEFFKVDLLNSSLIPTEIKNGYDPILICLKPTITELNKILNK